jgi:hypothetical protein
VRVLPCSEKVRWWAGCNGPPWWQEQDGWPQRFCTRARLAARTGPAETSCFSRLSSIWSLYPERPEKRWCPRLIEKTQ